VEVEERSELGAALTEFAAAFNRLVELLLDGSGLGGMLAARGLVDHGRFKIIMLV
jgi:hypothetical protein